MHIVRILFVPILVTILFFLSSVGIVVAAISQTVTERETVKTLLSQRSLYDSLKASITEGTLFDFEADQEQAPTADPQAAQANQVAISQVVERYFTVDFYNRSITTLVDAYYDWLEGKAERPEFTIPIANNPEEFKHFITDAFILRYQSLPVCPPGTLIDETFNPLEASCQIAGYDHQRIAAFINEQTEQPEFKQLYESAAIKSDTFAADIRPEDSRNAQATYKLLKNLGWLLPLLIVLVAGLIMLVLFNRHRGFKTVALTVLPPTLTLLVLAMAAGTLISRFIESIPSNQAAPSAADILLKEVLQSVYAAINNRLILISSLLSLAAAALLLTNYLVKRHSPAVPAKTS